MKKNILLIIILLTAIFAYSQKGDLNGKFYYGGNKWIAYDTIEMPALGHFYGVDVSYNLLNHFYVGVELNVNSINFKVEEEFIMTPIMAEITGVGRFEYFQPTFVIGTNIGKFDKFNFNMNAGFVYGIYMNTSIRVTDIYPDNKENLRILKSYFSKNWNIGNETFKGAKIGASFSFPINQKYRVGTFFNVAFTQLPQYNAGLYFQINYLSKKSKQ